jgi:hypothetical protein
VKSRAAAALLVCCVLAAVPARARAAQYIGTYALIGGTPSVRAVLRAAPARDPLQLALDLTLTAPGATGPLRAYETDATKNLHLIVVSDDFKTFLHVHPQLGGDGHFRLQLALPRAAVYYLYADSTPRGLGRQVFRFAVPAGRAKLPGVPPVLPAATNSALAGPYAVHLSRTSLAAGRASELKAVVSKDGRTAGDLRAYLGNAAHVVLIGATSLTYAHVHPMLPNGAMQMSGGAMAGMAAAPERPANLAENAPVPGAWTLHVGPMPAGTYAAWVQFRGGSRLHVARFTVTVK